MSQINVLRYEQGRGRRGRGGRGRGIEGKGGEGENIRYKLWSEIDIQANVSLLQWMTGRRDVWIECEVDWKVDCMAVRLIVG